MLELDEGKLSRPVLRRGGESNLASLSRPVCSSSILVETLGYAVSFSSPYRGKRRVFERCKPVFMDQLQPSTNSDKLSEALLWPSCLLHLFTFSSSGYESD